MKTIFYFDNYREYLKNMVEERRLRGHTKAELARVLECQAAYLSQVLAEKVDFTEEHLLRLAEYIEFNEVETEYLLTLLRIAKAGNQNMKRYLDRQRVKLKETAEELEPRLSSRKTKSANQDLNIYYSSSWLPSIIHLATSCERSQTVPAIAKKFGLSEELVHEHLRRLEKFGLVDFSNDRWKYSGTSIHFSKNSPLDLQLQMSRRLLAMNRLSFRKTSDLYYSVIFSTDPKTASQLRSQFLNTIEILHKTVEPTASEEVFAVCIDFFKA